jgi:serine/threonine protein kinase
LLQTSIWSLILIVAWTMNYLPTTYGVRHENTVYNYFVGRQLGAGLYGQVNIGILESTGQVVVLKQLHGRLRDAQKYFSMDLLKSEYYAFEQVTSLRQFATCHYQGKTMVTPFVNGVQLGDIYSDYTVDQWFSLCSGLTEQISNMHTLGITHGDLHLDNIRVSFGKISILDYGIAAANDPVGADKLESIAADCESRQERRYADIIKKEFIQKLCRQRSVFFDDQLALWLNEYLLDFTFSPWIFEKITKPFAEFIMQNGRDFVQQAIQYIQNMKPSPAEAILVLNALILRIAKAEQPSAMKLRDTDINIYLKHYYYVNLFAKLKVNAKVVNRHGFLQLARELEKIEPLKKEIYELLKQQKLLAAKQKIDEYKENLTIAARREINILLYNDEKYSGSHQSLCFLLSLLPIKERFNTLDSIWRVYAAKPKKGIKSTKLMSLIVKMYFAEYQQCISQISVDERIKLISHMRKHHRIPTVYRESFETETNYHFTSIPQEMIQQFTDSPSVNTLVNFLKVCPDFYQDRTQLRKQVRQAMVIISHLFDAASDADDTEHQQALQKLRQFVLPNDDANANQTKLSIKRVVYEAYRWVEKAASSPFSDLQDVKGKCLLLNDNPQFKIFIQQQQFQTHALSKIEQHIKRIERLKFFFDHKVTQSKVECLRDIAAQIEQATDFSSIGKCLNPNQDSALFEVRSHLFSGMGFFGNHGKDTTQTKTFKEFNELSSQHETLSRLAVAA